MADQPAGVISAPSRAPLRRRIVVVGSAARDIEAADPRGWRLGGGVTFGALLLGRLGLRTTAIIGLDAQARHAPELDLLRDAGVELIAVPLNHGPIFHNVEAPGGRQQTAHDTSDPIPPSVVRDVDVRDACAWLFAPVADEVPDSWADVPDPDAFVAIGWQGLLRDLTPGQPVIRRVPIAHPLIARAHLVAASVNEIPRPTLLRDVMQLLRPDAELLLTKGRRGGGIVGPDGRMRMSYAPVPARVALDPTGAGDVMLAALVAALVATRSDPAQPTRSRGRHLQFAATAASLLVEQPGLDAVPDRAAIRLRVASGNTVTKPA